MSQRQGKILVIRGGAIGDFILTLPAIAALRQQFPAAHLEVLGYPHIVSLAMAGGLVDRVQSIEARALAGFFARDGELQEDLMDYFSEFDLILSYLYDPDQIFQQNVARCSPAQFIGGPHRPDEKERVPAARAFLKPLERLAIFEADEVPRLSVRETVQESRQLALHPGSGSERKNWPEGNWAELLGELVNSTDLNLLIVGGEAEGERLQRLAAALPPSRTRVALCLPLPKLAALMQSSAGFLGHDSGISHLAAALGLPTVVLWGDTNEDVWRPPSRRTRIMRRPGGLAYVGVKDVMRQIEDLLGAKTGPERSSG